MLLDLVIDWINSEIPPISGKADKDEIAAHELRIEKASAIVQAVKQLQAANDQVVADEVAAKQKLAEQLNRLTKESAATIAQRDQEITNLIDRLSMLESSIAASTVNPNWQAIIDQLDEAGFDEHLEAAVAAGVGAFGAASRIIAAVQVADLATISKYWQSIVKKYPPKDEQLKHWQSILEESRVEGFSFQLAD